MSPQAFPDKKKYIIIDSVHNTTGFLDRLKPAVHDMVVEFNESAHEPKTSDVDSVGDDIVAEKGNELPRVIVCICHVLSYGIAFILGFRRGIANSIVFNHLEEFYGEDVIKCRQTVEKHNINTPVNVTKDLSTEQLNKMAELTYMLEKDLVSALGADFKFTVHGL